MATPVYPPTTTTSLLVNTRTAPKIVYLPAASTLNAGRMLFIKDICGNAGKSSIYVSTTGLDTIENRYRPSTLYALMSTNYQSMLLASDGLINWMILQNYNLNILSLPYQANLVADLRGTSYSYGGSTWVNSVDNSTWTMTNTTYDATNKGPLFDGSTTFAYKASLTGWSGSTFSILCYYYKSSTATLGSVLCMNRTASNITNEALFYENRYFDYGAAIGIDVSTTNSINTTGLVMDSFVKNGLTGTLYKNNTANGTLTASNNVTVGNADFCIGKDYRDNNSFLAGTIKRFLIYNIALTASDIANIYTIVSSS